MEEERDHKIQWRQESGLFVQMRMGERKKKIELGKIQANTGEKQVTRRKGRHPKRKSTSLGKLG